MNPTQCKLALLILDGFEHSIRALRALLTEGETAAKGTDDLEKRRVAREILAQAGHGRK